MENAVGSSRRLYKSRRDRMIDGICGGIAEYFGIDSTMVRLLWVLVTLMGGTGFFLYIVAMIIMPANPEHVGFQQAAATTNGRSDKRRFWGILLILIGSFVLLINVGLLAEINWWSFSRSVILPILLILLGIVLMFVHMKSKPLVGGSTEAATAPGVPPPAGAHRVLRRSITERKLFGVCGGIAKYFDIDPTIVRIVFVVIAIASFGWGILLYIILAILTPEDKLTPSST